MPPSTKDPGEDEGIVCAVVWSEGVLCVERRDGGVGG